MILIILVCQLAMLFESLANAQPVFSRPECQLICRRMRPVMAKAEIKSLIRMINLAACAECQLRIVVCRIGNNTRNAKGCAFETEQYGFPLRQSVRSADSWDRADLCL